MGQSRMHSAGCGEHAAETRSPGPSSRREATRIPPLPGFDAEAVYGGGGGGGVGGERRRTQRHARVRADTRHGYTLDLMCVCVWPYPLSLPVSVSLPPTPPRPGPFRPPSRPQPPALRRHRRGRRGRRRWAAQGGIPGPHLRGSDSAVRPRRYCAVGPSSGPTAPPARRTWAGGGRAP